MAGQTERNHRPLMATTGAEDNVVQANSADARTDAAEMLLQRNARQLLRDAELVLGGVEGLAGRLGFRRCAFAHPSLPVVAPAGAPSCRRHPVGQSYRCSPCPAPSPY